MAKLVPCKTCGVQIAKSAKVCPNCGAKQKKKNIVLGVIGILVAVAIIGAAAGSGGDAKPASSTSGSKAGPTETKTPEKTVFGVGEEVEMNDIFVTLVNVSESSGANYITPTDGKVFVICEFEIENNSSKEINVSSIVSFEAYIDDYSTSLSLSAMMSADKSQLDGTVAAGKKMNGVIGYEADKDWNTIEVRFTPNFWSNKDIIFEYSK